MNTGASDDSWLRLLLVLLLVNHHRPRHLRPKNMAPGWCGAAVGNHHHHLRHRHPAAAVNDICYHHSRCRRQTVVTEAARNSAAVHGIHHCHPGGGRQNAVAVGVSRNHHPCRDPRRRHSDAATCRTPSVGAERRGLTSVGEWRNGGGCSGSSSGFVVQFPCKWYTALRSAKVLQI